MDQAPDTLDPQPAAPPRLPPRRPIVGIAMADDDDLARLQAQTEAARLALAALVVDLVTQLTPAKDER